MLLKDKVALITAGASGMGRAGAERFAAEGAHVIVVDFNEANAAETVDGITPRAAARPRRSATCATWSAQGAGREGRAGARRLHVLYNNVGIPGAAGLELSKDEWDIGIEINARASLLPEWVPDVEPSRPRTARR